MLHGWLARTTGGPFRRNNSATPGPHAEPLIEALPELRTHFSSRNLPLVLRIPDMAQVGESDLAAAGFGAPEAWTATLVAPLDRIVQPEHPVVLETTPSEKWLAARAALVGENVAAAAATGRLVRSITDPIAFASVERDGRIVSHAFVIVAEGLAVFEAVLTAPEWRGKGLARACMRALLSWAGDNGAEAAALQVVADNDPAQHLYAGLGFAQCAYRYHYRRLLQDIG